MTPPLTVLLCWLIAAIVAIIVTRPVCIGALRAGLLDKPDHGRKLHSAPVAYGGGVVIYLGMITGMLPIFFGILTSDVSPFPGHFVNFFLLSTAFILGLGLLDDWKGLQGRIKLSGQVIACGLIVYAGVSIFQVSFWGFSVDLGVLSFPVTFIWLLAITNAFNLIDGADGVASSVAIVCAIALSIIAFLIGDNVDGLIAVSLAGGICGFLFVNLPPAKMFLGDAGSMVIGLAIAILGIRVSSHSSISTVLLVPTAVCIIPLFDLVVALVRRKMTDRSLFLSDRRHLHHCLQSQGYTPVMVVLTMSGLSLFTAFMAILSVYLKSDLIAFLAVIAVVTLLVASRTFGYTELLLLCTRVKNTTERLVIPFLSNHPQESQIYNAQFQGDASWGNIWEKVVDFAQTNQLSSIHFSINAPFAAQEYHANWKSSITYDFEKVCRAEIPLMCDGVRIGCIKVVSETQRDSSCAWVSRVNEKFTVIEANIIERMRLILDERPESPLVTTVNSATNHIVTESSRTPSLAFRDKLVSQY